MSLTSQIKPNTFSISLIGMKIKQEPSYYVETSNDGPGHSEYGGGHSVWVQFKSFSNA